MHANISLGSQTISAESRVETSLHLDTMYIIHSGLTMYVQQSTHGKAEQRLGFRVPIGVLDICWYLHGAGLSLNFVIICACVNSSHRQ